MKDEWSRPGIYWDKFSTRLWNCLCWFQKEHSIEIEGRDHMIELIMAGEFRKGRVVNMGKKTYNELLRSYGFDLYKDVYPIYESTGDKPEMTAYD